MSNCRNARNLADNHANRSLIDLANRSLIDLANRSQTSSLQSVLWIGSHFSDVEDGHPDQVRMAHHNHHRLQIHKWISEPESGEGLDDGHGHVWPVQEYSEDLARFCCMGRRDNKPNSFEKRESRKATKLVGKGQSWKCHAYSNTPRP